MQLSSSPDAIKISCTPHARQTLNSDCGMTVEKRYTHVTTVEPGVAMNTESPGDAKNTSFLRRLVVAISTEPCWFERAACLPASFPWSSSRAQFGLQV